MRINHSDRGDHAENREIRMFISSTFIDMQMERDELIKHIFLDIRKMCEDRGVTWGQVAFRWGITDEQSAEGQVLPICLEEVEKCRPYFIGILGERYGWVPDKIDPPLMERVPWLKEHLNHSVTELEITYSVFNKPDAPHHAFFYFRSPSDTNTIAEGKKGGFIEDPTAEEIARYGEAEVKRRTQDRRGKLSSLKDRIRKSGFPLKEGYSS